MVLIPNHHPFVHRGDIGHQMKIDVEKFKFGSYSQA